MLSEGYKNPKKLMPSRNAFDMLSRKARPWHSSASSLCLSSDASDLCIPNMVPLLPSAVGNYTLLRNPCPDKLLLSGSKMAKLTCTGMQAGGVRLTDVEASL